MSNILLATFCLPKHVMSNCRKLWEKFPYEESLEKIFLLEVDNEDKKILTFNLSQKSTTDIDYKNILPGVVRIHRKEKTDTLYTINAINAIQLVEYGSVNIKNEIDWEKYRQCFLIERNNELVCLKTKLERIFHKTRKSTANYNDSAIFDF
jgi:hypothetical protein